MSARKVKERWTVDFWFEHASGKRERVRKAAPVNTRRGAEEFERQLRVEMLSPTVAEKVVHFADYADEFESVFVKANLKYATQVTYESTIRYHLVPEFGPMLLGEITGQRVERFKAKLMGAETAAKTVRNTLGVLSRMLHVAKDWGYLTEVPAIRLPKVPAPRFRFLSDEDSRRLLEAADPYWRAPIFFALMTGCRQGEIWAMERDQVDLDNAMVRVDRAVYRGRVGLPKHDRVRTIELSETLTQNLREHLSTTEGALVFASKEGGIRWGGQADAGLRKAAKSAGIEPLGWHVLRHTFASRLAMRGVPLQAVQQLLGHARIDETMRYAHLSPGAKRDAVSRLDDLGAPTVGQPMGIANATHEQVGER